MKSDEIRTARLLLKMPAYKDETAVFEIHGDPETNRFNPSGPHPNLQRSRQQLEHWIAHWKVHDFGYWSVSLVEKPDYIIGFGGIIEKNIDGEDRLNLYYRFRPEVWGNGYASEMAQQVIDFGFQTLNRNEIVATVRETNRPSIRVMERLGMEFRNRITNEKGESLLYSINRQKA